MAIQLNDNIRANVNRPTDFRFGPFDSIAQANSIIPIAQRYHGLIFGVYTNPGNIATSDIDFFYYWNALADTDVLPLGGKPPVDGEYANQAAMITAQASQTAQYIYYDNASYWEYLGTTNGNITDYRLISFTFAGPITNGNVLTIVAGVPTWQAPVSTSKWTDTTGGIYYSNAIGVGTSTLVSGRSATFNSDIQVNSLRVGRGNNNNISNAVLGDSALNANTSGFSNLALGQSALLKNTSGYINAGIGPQSLRETTTGIFNTAAGGSAMQENTTGSWNTGIGGQAIAASTTSSFNSAVGGLSISDLLTSSNHNAALGYRAGKYIASIADLVGNFLTSSNQSVFVGSETMAGFNSITNSIVIGYRAIGLGSNTTVVGNSSTTFGRWWGNLLLGTSTNSTFLLDVNGTVRIQSNLTLSDSQNLILGTTNGAKIGTSTSQKIGFWNTTPIVQPTTAIAESAFVENAGGTAVNDDSTFDGYTLRQVVKALRDAGLLA